MYMLEPSHVDIRFAQEADLPYIVDLCREHAKYEQTGYNSENKVELLSEFIFGQSPAVRCLVVVHENSIIGYATFMKQFSTWDAGFYIYLDCLFIKESFRGKSFGMQLMKKVKEYAEAENCSIIQWQTPVFNQKAINFYRKIGGVSKTKERFILH